MQNKTIVPGSNHLSIKVFESRGLNDQENRAQVIKNCAADLWTMIHDIEIPPGNSESGRLVSLSKTDLESCVMWAIKALSRNY